MDIEILSDGRHTIWNSAGIKYIVHAPDLCKDQVCVFHNPTDHHMIHWPWYMFQYNGYLVQRMCRHYMFHPDPDSLDYFMRGSVYRGDPMLGHVLDTGCDQCCLIGDA